MALRLPHYCLLPSNSPINADRITDLVVGIAVTYPIYPYLTLARLSRPSRSSKEAGHQVASLQSARPMEASAEHSWALAGLGRTCLHPPSRFPSLITRGRPRATRGSPGRTTPCFAFPCTSVGLITSMSFPLGPNVTVLLSQSALRPFSRARRADVPFRTVRAFQFRGPFLSAFPKEMIHGLEIRAGFIGE